MIGLAPQQHLVSDLLAGIARRRLLVKDVAEAMGISRRRLTAILAQETIADETYDRVWTAIAHLDPRMTRAGVVLLASPGEVDASSDPDDDEETNASPAIHR